MATPAERLLTAYRRRLTAVQAEVARQIAELYGDIDPDAIDASFRAFIVQAAPLIEAGQQSTSALAAAFLRSLTFVRTGRPIEIDDLDEIPGTRPDGSPLVAGMEAFGPMVLGRIADGASVDDALEFGRYLATRYADGELTSAADRTIEEAPRGRFSSWEGIVNPGSCDACQENAGTHDVEVAIYRHPGCNCVYVPLIDTAA